MDKHTTIGIDCVAMCVNDIICCGAKPQFFLDYIALGKNVPEKVAAIVSGVAEGCVQAGCALVGGETAEMPGFYPEDEYDVAGFAVGVVDRNKILDSNTQKAGDVLIALQSSGVHSNGYSLIRIHCKQPESGTVFSRSGYHSWRVSADTDQDLCVCNPEPAAGSSCKVYCTHHRRRLLREHSPCTEEGTFRKNQPQRCSGSPNF